VPKSILYLVFAILSSVVAILLIIVYRYATTPLPASSAASYASAMEQNADIPTDEMIDNLQFKSAGWSDKLVNRERLQTFSYPVREFQIRLN